MDNLNITSNQQMNINNTAMDTTAQKRIELMKAFRYSTISAMQYGCFMQFVLLFIFSIVSVVYVINPIKWIMNSWLILVPLLFLVCLYHFILFGRIMATNIYKPTRCLRLFLPIMPKLTFLGVHILFGTFMALMYSKWLTMEPIISIYFNEKNTYFTNQLIFLLCIGLWASITYFAQNFTLQDAELEFNIIQRRIQILHTLPQTIYDSFAKTLFPTITCAVIYVLAITYINPSYMESRPSLMIQMYTFHCAWVLHAHIYCNLLLLNYLLSHSLCDKTEFPITNCTLSLCTALEYSSAPALQQLASLQLYLMSLDPARSNERQQLFSLTEYSNNPYHWHKVSRQSLQLINTFTKHMEKALNSIKDTNSTIYTNKLITNDAAPTLLARQFLLRNQNAVLGIRQMETDVANVNAKENAVQMRITQYEELLKKKLISIYRNIPGLFYCFGEDDYAIVVYLLNNSQHIIWLTQGLAGLCALSIHEDRYGVVQNTLPEVFDSLIQLKLILDKLNNIHLNGMKNNRKLSILKSAVKRSLYKLCSVFGDYLHNIISDPQQLSQLHHFLTYSEI